MYAAFLRLLLNHPPQNGGTYHIFCDDRKPGGVTIQPVDAPEHERLAALLVQPCQRIAERIVRVVAGGMDWHSGGLVDHHQVVVLIDDLHRKLHRADLLGGILLPDRHAKHIARLNEPVHVDTDTIQPDALFILFQIYKVLLRIPLPL